MKVEPREIQSILVRHLSFKGVPNGDHVVWWYGAVLKNQRTQSLPHVTVFFRKLHADGTLGSGFRREVGITDLGLLQIGTIWSNWSCDRRLELQEREFQVDFSPGHWRFTSQHEHKLASGKSLIPQTAYPLEYGDRDLSQLLSFDLGRNRELLIPSLEFYSRYYGRSGHVARVLSTYPWSEAQDRLYLPFEKPNTAAKLHWPVRLASNTYNSDAVFLAHVMYDTYAQRAAKSVYAGLEAQYQHQGGLAFPKIYPWFRGPAVLIVQGHWVDQSRFLALRIEGGSDPKGPSISIHRENPGKAETPAPMDAPTSGWKGGRNPQPDNSPPFLNLTSDDEPDQSGNIVEVVNPAFRLVGLRRVIFVQRLHSAATQPGQPTPYEQVDQHSAGERHGSARGTGVASVHTEVVLESHGAMRDVWDALQLLKATSPDQILAVGWYSADSGEIHFSDDPSMATLSAFMVDGKDQLGTSLGNWVYLHPDEARLRGVLISYVRTPICSAFLFEIERRKVSRTANDGRKYADEEAFCGLVVAEPTDMNPKKWIPRVLDGIRKERGVMERVLAYCPGNSARHYRRSTSSADLVSGHSTVINALSKVGIEIPRPKTSSVTGSAEENTSQEQV